MSLYARYAALLDGVLDALVADGSLPADLPRKAVAVEPPRDASHGDLATNAAMVLAKGAGTNPRALAGLIAPKLEALPGVTEVAIAGPGFINLRLDEDVWRTELATILAEGDAYGRSSVGEGERVNVEYVSANPTGPMHMGHCRGAVVGDALAQLARSGGLRRHARILCQRRRRPGRYARPLGAPSLPRGAWRGCRRDPRGLVSGRLSDPGRRDARRRIWRPLRRCAGGGMAGAVPQAHRRGDARPDPGRFGAARHPPRHLRVRSRARSSRRSGPRDGRSRIQGARLSRRARAAEKPRRS